MDSRFQKGKTEFVSWILPPPGCFAKEIDFVGVVQGKAVPRFQRRDISVGREWACAEVRVG
jgi:hypothetical protein